MALPAPDREPREKPPLWIIQEAFEGDEPAEQPQDVYILHLLRALPPDLIQSLTPDQYQRLKQSLHSYHRRHMLDVRGCNPVFVDALLLRVPVRQGHARRFAAVDLERRAPARWARWQAGS
jgi:hypothetical protein